MILRLLREPLLQFLVLGAMLFALYGLLDKRGAEATEKIVVRNVWVDGDDVLTWFDLHMPGAPATAVAQWCHLQDGKVNRVEVTFDPRGILAAAS